MTPAVKLGIVDRRWTLEDVVAMTNDYVKAQGDAVFAAAFEGFVTQPKAARAYDPVAPKTPWYLDKDSGGPNPEVKKPGVATLRIYRDRTGRGGKDADSCPWTARTAKR